MVKNIKKLPFPDFLLKTPYTASLYQAGISEDGEPTTALTVEGKCIFSEKARRIIDADGKQITLLGRVIVKGDIAPSLKTISDGVITINENTYEIHAGYRPRNPDGSIHHTMFEIK